MKDEEIKKVLEFFRKTPCIGVYCDGVMTIVVHPDGTKEIRAEEGYLTLIMEKGVKPKREIIDYEKGEITLEF